MRSFRLRRGTGEDRLVVLPEKPVEFVLAHALELIARDDDAAAPGNSDPTGNLAGGEAVVARYDDDADPGCMAARDGVGHLLPRRVEEHYKPEQAEVALGVLPVGRRLRRIWQPSSRDREHA